MKKTICVLISLILILASFVPGFAARLYEVDDQTGAVVNTDTGDTSAVMTISADCYYDKSLKCFVYTTGLTSNTNIYSTVYDGMIVSEVVSIVPESAAHIEIYRNGELVDEAEYQSLETPGSYVVMNQGMSGTIFSFKIVADITNAIDMYRVPDIFYVAEATLNDGPASVSGNDIDLSEDGKYSITCIAKKSELRTYLNITVDHTPPVLEIIGLDEDGVARGPISFGSLEANSMLRVMLDGVDVTDDYADSYTEAGTYSILYYDEAGNLSTYYFVMHVFLNVSAWVFVALAAAILILLIVYIIYSRKSLRVR